MSTAGWPRMMRIGTAAAYLDLTKRAFEAEVFDGRLPVPVMLGGSEHWSRVLIDQAIDRITGDVAPNWRSASKLYS